MMRYAFFFQILIWVTSASGATPAPSDDAIFIYPHGGILLSSSALSSNLTTAGKSPRIVCQFGLPAQAPDRRWLENDQLPIFQTAWETNGIRYTQKVLLTSLGTNDPSLASPTHPESVVLVQITGLNTNAEYTSASASFAIELGGRPLELELREGLIYVSGSPEAAPMGALDIPGEGITAARGPQLKFQGNMPPGTSGSMTVKIPVTALKDPKAITRLQDLDFDEQLQRVKKAWKHSLQANSLSWPFTWVEPEK